MRRGRPIAPPFWVVLFFSFAVSSGEDPPRGSYESMDYGPVIGESIRAGWPEENVALKGLAVRLDHDSAMIFDADLLRWSAGTTGGWADLSRTTLVRHKDEGLVHTEGREVFATEPLPGWGHRGSFADPREDSRGNLPRDWAHYRGYYRHGDRIVLSYTVGGTPVLEMPRAIEIHGAVVFVRTLQMDASAEEREGYLCAVPEGATPRRISEDALLLESEGKSLLVGLAGAPEGAGVRVGAAGRVQFFLPASREAPEPFHVFLTEVEARAAPMVLETARTNLTTGSGDLHPLLLGGAARWPEEVRAPVTLAGEEAAYVVDSIGLPEPNPWGAWIRPTAIEFFEAGDRAAVATWNGDVWIAEGLGPEMKEEVRWRRFASGLYYPMGLVVRNGLVHVLERGQITRLHDLNGNGEADFYENVNNDSFIYPLAHALCLEADSEGNFYFFKNGNRVPEGVPDHAALIRVYADGSRREIVATGIRGANSLAIGPDDMIVATDQQGRWVPTARVDHIRDGGFYGYLPHRGAPEREFEPPICWVPHQLDNSSGGMAYAGDERWGPMSGNFLLTSYGQGRLFAILMQEIGGRWQGGVVPFPLDFGSGLMGAAVGPADGQLYLVGMRGWSTRTIVEAAFDRVRYTGLPNRLPVALKVSPRGVELTFSEPLSERTGREDFEVERWQYEYGPRYGSPPYSLANPGQEGRDRVEVAAVHLSPDRRTVLLEIPDIRPVMQMKVAYRLTFGDGGLAENAVYHTIHKMRPEDEVPRVVAPERIAERQGGKAEEPEETLVATDLPELENAPEWISRGRQLVQTNCVSCHDPSGLAGIAPPLAESDWASGPAETFVRIVLHGKLGERGAMMPFGWMEDAELASLLSYIRQAWHDEPVVTPEEIDAIRKADFGRTELWTESELNEILTSLNGKKN